MLTSRPSVPIAILATREAIAANNIILEDVMRGQVSRLPDAPPERELRQVLR